MDEGRQTLIWPAGSIYHPLAERCRRTGFGGARAWVDVALPRSYARGQRRRPGRGRTARTLNPRDRERAGLPSPPTPPPRRDRGGDDRGPREPVPTTRDTR